MMQRSYTTTFMAFALLLCTLPACGGNRATGPNFQAIIHPGPDEAIVYFYRDARSDAPQAPDWIYAFDKIIRLDPGGYTFEIIPSGRYLISLQSKRTADDLWFEFRGRETAFFKWTPLGIGNEFEAKLLPVFTPQALAELPDCRLMQLDPGGRP